MEAVGFVELLAAPAAKRRWSDEAKGQMVAETLVPRVTVNEVARRHGLKATYAPGRGGQHAERILQGFGGILQVDGYAGYNRLIAADRIGPGIQLAYCWAHARRKLIEITRTGPAPIAEEGVALMDDMWGED
ncbi:Transposase IS66 family protein [Paracoccus haematequi]|uniref:Transposase IS66 family protein n=1 Tax=Paracoccus haematequi TaxID=2491866 RepID=A0A3S4CJ23_9RHOB|nr:Transposase IS66 family protein [Paracoccus haematequi]